VLEHRGKRLSQLGVILHYLAAPLRQIRRGNEDERREILRWMFWDNHKATATLPRCATWALAKVGEPQDARLPARAHEDLARHPGFSLAE